MVPNSHRQICVERLVTHKSVGPSVVQGSTGVKQLSETNSLWNKLVWNKLVNETILLLATLLFQLSKKESNKYVWGGLSNRDQLMGSRNIHSLI